MKSSSGTAAECGSARDPKWHSSGIWLTYNAWAVYQAAFCRRSRRLPFRQLFAQIASSPGPAEEEILFPKSDTASLVPVPRKTITLIKSITYNLGPHLKYWQKECTFGNVVLTRAQMLKQEATARGGRGLNAAAGCELLLSTLRGTGAPWSVAGAVVVLYLAGHHKRDRSMVG